ncbi:MAG: AEC family transporter [Deferrisomatales bacterium]|nr:AEC family transporter [Deferrisomatales bacterium]
MSPTLAALLPIFAIIALGYTMRRLDFPGQGFWAPAERLTYFVLFPALLVNNLANAEFGDLPAVPMALAIGATFTALSLGLIALRRRLRVDGPGFTSVFQGAVRMNTYVGLAGAVALGGQVGLTLAAVAIAVIVPLVNLFSVSVLCRYAGDRPAPLGRVAGELARNPLLLACAVGLALNGLGRGVPWGGGAVLSLLGRAALTIGLLAAGAGLQLQRIRRSRGLILATAGLKLVVLPLLTALVCKILGVDGLPATVAVLFSALPGAPSAYILARQMGGDAPLMASIITVETAFACATLPAVLSWLG